MRVLFLSEFFRPFVGGIEVLAAKLLPALDQRGYEFLVVTSHGPMELADEDRLGDIRVLRYPFRPAFTAKAIDQIIELRRSLLTVARDYDPDVIHLNGASPLLLFTLPLLAGGAIALAVTGLKLGDLHAAAHGERKELTRSRERRQETGERTVDVSKQLPADGFQLAQKRAATGSSPLKKGTVPVGMFIKRGAM